MSKKLQKAYATFTNAMMEDPDYAWSWHCNIAMPIYDSGIDHLKANQIAARLMEHLFNVNMIDHPHYQDILNKYSLSGDLFDNTRESE